MESEKENKIKSPFVGNNKIIDYFSKSVKNSNISSFYLFLGPRDLGKVTMAEYLAKLLLCRNRTSKNILEPCEKCPSCQQLDFQKNDSELDDLNIIHGDFHILHKEKDKKNITVDQVRDLISQLNMSSFFGSYKIGIIKNAQDLSEEAANALLKTLEEPKQKVIIFMTSDNEDGLPKTIISRSQVFRFYPADKNVIYDHLVDDYQASRSLAKNLSRLSLGRPALSIKYLKDQAFYEEYLNKARAFLAVASTDDINSRLEIISNAVGKNFFGQEAAKETADMLNVWQGLIRDLMLANYDLVDLMQHQVLESEIFKIKSYFKISRIIQLDGIFQRGKEYLRANVNPKAVIEGVVINI